MEGVVQGPNGGILMSVAGLKRWAHKEAVTAMEPLSVYLTVDDRVDVVHCHKGMMTMWCSDPKV